MNRTCTALGAALLLLARSPASADQGHAPPRVQMPRQGAPMPPRDTSARPSAPVPEVGTATLAGRVVAADSGLPLRRATVTARPTRPPDPPRRGEAFQIPRSVSARTDDEGRFTIAALPAGDYLITARRPGYVEAGFGQVTSRTPVRRVSVAHGAAVGPIDFHLQRGGVITGRVVDDGGEPAERVTVRAVQQRRMGGQVRLVGGSQDQTDDQGHYRIFGLPPGEYLVMAEPGDRGPFRMGGTVQGVEIDTIPTFGPGTVNPADAMKVPVQAGLEAAMDVQLIAAKVAAVRGRVLTSAGEPLQGGVVRLQPAGGEFVGMGLGMGQGGRVMAGGEFEIDAVAPGTYLIIAHAMAREGAEGPDGPAPEQAIQTITVEGEDLVVALTTTPGSTARGRVVVEGEASALASRALRILSFPTGPQATVSATSGRGRVAPDLTFEVTGLRGEQALGVQPMPEGWWIKDVRIGGQPALHGFDFGQGKAFTGAEIVISTRPTGLTGSVTLPTGATATDYAVVLFPEDESTWDQPPGPGQASARMIRPGLDGAFTLRGVRPGSYYVLAVPAAQAESQALTDPDQLRELAGRARSVEVKDGLMSSLTLTLVQR